VAVDSGSSQPPLARMPCAAALGVILLALVGPTAAQTPTRNEPFPLILEGRRWGPFLVEPSFAIDNIGYDSNVFLTPPGVPARSDYVVRLGPELHAQLRLGHRMALTLRDRLQGELFVSTPRLNHADNEFEGQFDTLLGPVLLTAEGQWSTLRFRPNSAEDARSRQDRRNVRFSARLFLGARTDFVVSTERQRLRYSDPDPGGELIAERLDRNERVDELEIGWRLSSGTRLFGRLRSIDHDFVIDTEGRDARERRSVVGIALRPSSRLDGELRVGRVDLESRTGRFHSFSGAISSLSTTYRPTGRSRFRLSGKRDVVFSTFFGNLYFEEEKIELAAETYLGRLFGVQAGLSRSRLDFPETTAQRFENPADTRRLDRISNSYAGILLRLGRETSISVRYGRRVRDSNVVGLDDVQNYVSTSTSFSF